MIVSAIKSFSKKRCPRQIQLRRKFLKKRLQWSYLKWNGPKRFYATIEDYHKKLHSVTTNSDEEIIKVLEEMTAKGLEPSVETLRIIVKFYRDRWQNMSENDRKELLKIDKEDQERYEHIIKAIQSPGLKSIGSDDHMFPQK